ncbi:survival protein SurA [Bdellovibrio sp. qaytius]|nr:survival protein SurA [Bdellovibrio sp. qaytius]
MPPLTLWSLKPAKNKEINKGMKRLAFALTFILSFSTISAFAAPTKEAVKDSGKKAELVDKIIATVGSEAVLQSDLNEIPARLKREGSIDETMLLEDKLDDLKTNRSAQLQYLIREKLVESEIKRQNLSFTEDRVNEEMGNLAKKNQMNRAELDVYLKKQGYNLVDYKKTLKSRLERQSFFETEIVAKLRITDEDAYNEYKNRNPKYKPNVNELKVGMIFFNPRKGTPEEAFKRAEAVYKKLQAGESFEALADKFNEDPNANAGGFLGQFKTGELNADMEKALSRLETGEYSQVVRSSNGFQILKVIDKKVTQDPTFLRYKEQIKAGLVEKNFKRQLKNWFESKKQDAYIKLYE